MCLDLLEELAEASRNAAALKKQHELFKEGMKIDEQRTLWELQLTAPEAEMIHKARVDAAEAKLKGLGWTPPAKKVTEGDREKELKAAGHTLPGEIPLTQPETALPVPALGAS